MFIKERKKRKGNKKKEDKSIKMEKSKRK